MSIFLGLRMTFSGGRESLARTVLTACGVALGVTLLLVGLAGRASLDGRAERSAWQDTEASTPATAADSALWLAVSDHFAGRALHRVHVAALGPRPPVPPGLDRLPGPGEVALSPALRSLLATTPADQLGDRFPGRRTMTIGAAGLRHPDHLVAVIGQTREELGRLGGAEEVRGIATRPLDLFGISKFELAFATILLLFPMMVFIVMVTRIGAVRREGSLAALRMAGATRLQMAGAAAVETGLAAATGTVAGWLGYLAVRPVVVMYMSFGGYQPGRPFLADFVVPPAQTVAVLLCVPALALVTTVVSLHRVRITPAGTGGRLPGSPPSAWRALPVLLGVGGFAIAAAVLRDRPDLAESSTAGGVLDGLMLCSLVGSVVIGPWACHRIGLALARFGRRATTLMAARRLAAGPRAANRAVSGVALAVFVSTLLSGNLGAISQDEAWDLPYDSRLRPGVVEIFAGGLPEADLMPLISAGAVVARGGQGAGVSVRCADLARVVEVVCPLPSGFGNVRRPPATAALGMAFNGAGVFEPGPEPATSRVQAVYIPTDGSVAAEERIRTRAAVLLPRAIISTRSDRYRQVYDLAPVYDVGTVAGLVTLFVLLVAGCSLTISLVSGLLERRRPFALLRAAGMSVGELRRVALLETAVPMVFTALLGAALASVPASVYAILGDQPYPSPGLDFALLLGGGLLAALIITASALPLVNAATRYDAIRYE